jgi:Family of unknown function (DUF5335)
VQKNIERNDWARFFESFTMQHDRWLVSVDGEKDTLPLEGITTRDDGNVVITLGGDISHHRRIIIDARSVRVQQSDGTDEGVEIESNDGHTTRLRFRSPMPPELVDGIAP